MKMMITVLIVMSLSKIVIADDKPVRIGIDGEPKNAAGQTITKRLPKVTESKAHKKEIDRILHNMEVKPVKPVPAKPALKNRLWVEDVRQPGLWYWGWYDRSDRKFHYTRRQQTSGLTNFISIVPYSRAYNVGSSEPWGVVYDP